MFNIYGRKLPDPEQIARNLVQLAEEDSGRARRLRFRRGAARCLFAFGASNPRWWVSPLCCTSALMVGFLMRDWSWRVLDVMLTRIGFQ